MGQIVFTSPLFIDLKSEERTVLWYEIVEYNNEFKVFIKTRHHLGYYKTEVCEVTGMESEEYIKGSTLVNVHSLKYWAGYLDESNITTESMSKIFKTKGAALGAAKAYLDSKRSVKLPY